MSVIKAENWDGVTAPAVPTGWNVSANLATATGTVISAPNALALASGAGAADNYATWGTADTSSGNVSVYALFYFTTLVGGGPGFGNRCGVAARGSTSSLNSSATTQYVGWLTTDTASASKGQLSISKFTSGTEFGLSAGVSLAGANNVQAATWYLVRLDLNGSSLILSCQRQTDGYWCNSSGVFAAAAAAAVSITDTSITGSGYAGLAMNQGAVSQGLYSDNWELDTLLFGALPPPWYRQPVPRNDVPRYWV
jgi:hypothetical protein